MKISEPVAEKKSVPHHWGAMAEIWKQVAPPLRPSAEDRDSYWSFIAGWIQDYARPRILLLGVTPELYSLPWPADHDLLAMDRAREMIHNFWPGPREHALEADWCEMPLPNESRDLVLCDGGLILLDCPGQRSLVDRLHKLLAPGGRCVFRLFVLPTAVESSDFVMNEFLAGRIASPNLFKLRMGMALQKSHEEGVAVQDLWRMLREVDPDWDRLAARVAWPVEELRALEAYRGSPAHYHYNTHEATEALFCAGGQFSYLGYRIGNYPLAERCPVVTFARR